MLKRKLFPVNVLFILTCVLLAAAVITGINYIIAVAILDSGGGSMKSNMYETTASLGSAVEGGSSESVSYRMESGYISQYVEVTASLPTPELNLKSIYVYPNPFKPGSGGKYDADCIVFKNLTAEADIKIFNVAGELVASMEKEDMTVDYCMWPAENDDGKKVASGVYVYLITNPAGEKATGILAIIK